jgi:hypothetical protein
MARPVRLLSLAVLSALLAPAMQLAGGLQPLQAARSGEAARDQVLQKHLVPNGLRGVGDRFLNGSGAGNQITHQESVPLDAARSPGLLGTGDPSRFGTTQEPWALYSLNGKDPKVRLPLPADLGKAVPLTPQTGLKQDRGATLLEVEGQLEDDDQVLQDGSLYDLHTFEGEAGQFIEIRLSSDAFDTYLILVGPDGERVAENDDSSEGLNSIIQIQLLQKGRYSGACSGWGSSQKKRVQRE